MKINDVSVCMASSEDDIKAFEFARTFAEAHNAHLSCAAFSILPPMFTGYGIGGAGEVYVSIIKETRDMMKTAWDKFEKKLVGKEPAVEMRHFETFSNHVEAVSAINARHADLVIVRAPDESDEQPHADIVEGVLLGGGRPVLVLPVGWSGKSVGDRVVVGWDASREAARALHDSMLILSDDAKVCIATVDASPGETGYGEGPGWDIGGHLSRHGYNVEVRNEDSIGRSVAHALLDLTTSYDADLIVLGGYRHSRLLQAVLPGVTRTLLRKSNVPLLLSH
jgi:nucleotide-binding universal stress UspA family protein